MAELAEIVDRVARKLGPPTASAVPLDGGITNRNYRVAFAGRDYVIRLPGKDTELLGISREAERIAAGAAAALAIGPVVALAEPDCLVTEYLPCTPLRAGELSRAPEPVAVALRAFHDSGAELPVAFWVPDLLERYAKVITARGGSLPAGYGEMQSLARRIGQALPLSDPVPCHDDLLPGNVLRLGGRLMLVDWEYAAMGHRLFDLANLAAGHELDEPAERRLLSAYLGEPSTVAQWSALRLMRIMSDARESAWGAVQGVLSDLDFDFAGYARRHYERLQLAAQDARLQEWFDAAAA